MELRYNGVGGPCGWPRKPCSLVKGNLLHLLPRLTEMARDLGEIILSQRGNRRVCSTEGGSQLGRVPEAVGHIVSSQPRHCPEAQVTWGDLGPNCRYGGGHVLQGPGSC